MIRGLGAGASVPPRVAVLLRAVEMSATRPASMVACGPPRDFGCGPWQLFARRWVPSSPCVYLDGLVASRVRVASVRRRSWNPGFAFGPSRYSGFVFWPFGAEKRLWMDRGRTPLLWMARGRTLLLATASGWTKPEPGIPPQPPNGLNPNPESGGSLQTSETRTRDSVMASKWPGDEPGIPLQLPKRPKPEPGIPQPAACGTNVGRSGRLRAKSALFLEVF